MGTLYLISTPIGNLEDLGERAGRLLGTVGLVLAEDTRHTSKLTRHLGIAPKLLSLHRHNEEARVPEILDRLAEGIEVALVSDAGTPLVSDPGERLVRRVLDEGHDVVPIPGPSAVLTALVGSGLPTIPFTFLGFVPRKGRERSEALERIATSRETLVAFESPERLATLLDDLSERCGSGRRAAVARELTKLHEEFRRGTLEELARYYSGDGAREDGESPTSRIRGEVTLVVAPLEDEAAEARVDVLAGEALARALLADGLRPSHAARELSRRLGIARNQAYDLVQGLTSSEAKTPSQAPESNLDET